MIACYIAMHAGASCSGFHDEVTTLDVSRIKTIFLGALFSEVQAVLSPRVINNINMAVQFIYMNVAARILRNTAETFHAVRVPVRLLILLRSVLPSILKDSKPPM